MGERTNTFASFFQIKHKMAVVLTGDQAHHFRPVESESGRSEISENRLADSESESESEQSIMTKISNTIKDREAGELEVFNIEDVETSTDTVDSLDLQGRVIHIPHPQGMGALPI